MSQGSMQWINELVRQPERWATADGRQLAVVALLELTGAGPNPSAETLQRLRYLYSCVAQRSTVDDRQRLIGGVTEKLGDTAAAAAMYCVIALEEREHALILRAALELALHQTPSADDPLAGPRLLRRFAEDAHTDDITRTGLLSALLMLGDRRVLPILDGCWDLLEQRGQTRLASADTGYTYASTILFLLNWMKASLQKGDHSMFGFLTGSLGALLEIGRPVIDIERRFPVWQDDGTPPIRMRQHWAPDAYAYMVQPQLMDLLRREPHPQVLPNLLEEWGLPRS